MNILFTICGRAGSKGIKNKNIRDFHGKPLVYYTLSAIDLYIKEGNSEHLYDIVLNTDSVELIELINVNPLRSVDVIKRDESLSGDVVGKIDVIHNCLDVMEDRKGCKYDLVVDLDITSPLRCVGDIKRVIGKSIETEADVTTTVVLARRNPYFNQLCITEHGCKRAIESDFTARQQAPVVYDMNASIYAYNPLYLQSGKGVFDGYLEVVEMHDTGVLDLDHENDFELMEVIAQRLFETLPNMKAIRDNIQSS